MYWHFNLDASLCVHLDIKSKVLKISLFIILPNGVLHKIHRHILKFSFGSSFDVTCVTALTTCFCLGSSMKPERTCETLTLDNNVYLIVIKKIFQFKIFNYSRYVIKNVIDDKISYKRCKKQPGVQLHMALKTFDVSWFWLLVKGERYAISSMTHISGLSLAVFTFYCQESARGVVGVFVNTTWQACILLRI